MNKYLPPRRVAEKFDRPVTIADLLTHTAGLGEIPGVAGAGARLSSPITLRATSRFAPSAKERIAYSNTGIALAISSRGRPHRPMYAAVHIFRPLGMMRSSFRQPSPQVTTGVDARSPVVSSIRTRPRRS